MIKQVLRRKTKERIKLATGVTREYVLHVFLPSESNE